MDSVIPLHLFIGFALRTFLLAFDRQSHLRPVFLGVWEGIALYRALDPESVSQPTAYLSCAARLTFDFLFTENVPRMMTILLSLALAFLISDALGSYHDHIRARHRSEIQPSRVSGTRVIQVYEVSDSYRLNRRPRLVITPRASGPAVAATISSVVHEGNTGHAGHVPSSATQVYEVPDSPRLNRRPRLVIIPRAIRPAEMAATLPPVVRDGNADDADRVLTEDSPSPIPVHTVGAYFPIPNPITPPARMQQPTPPQHSSPRHTALFQDLNSDSESHKDELQTPPSLANQQNFWPTAAVGQEWESHGDEDDLQTPLVLNLRDLPPIPDSLDTENEGRPLVLEDIPFLDESASALFQDEVVQLGADDDNVSELSLETGTESSIISDNNAQITISKAERLRQQAWDEQKQKTRFEQELSHAVSQRRIKDAFLLRIEIAAAEERAQKIHSRAARRHYRGKPDIT
ncbi:hypothetical protein B0H17DRAFT_97323 [Mycena rosella]|uniref:Uncharacterized protein n=1 Tax=Mycena rosella TaxID=1033263 RepID=A0AAD7GR51_MYCRO|nr:hypothetical protein B0H17DRAFT_97323 [Mycena rosella]